MRTTKLFILLLLLAVLLSFTALAEETAEDVAEESDELVITSDYACVYNVESGEILYGKGAYTTVYPGSLVKIMTVALAMEKYSSMTDTVITVSDTALDTLKGNNVRLKEGEKVSFYDLCAAVAVGGANDAALVLAETVGGSVDGFVDMMNQKAKELGAVNTQFDNPTGYHSPRMYTTLADLAKICQWANTIPEYMKLSSLVSYTMPATDQSKERVFTNSNLLLDPKHWLRHYIEGTSGMNAGMTYEAGYTLATVYDNDGQTNIVIIVGGKVDGWDYHYFNDVAKLIEHTSKNYEYKTLVSRDKPVAELVVLYGKESDYVLVTTKNEVEALLPNDALESDITSDYTLNAEVCKAPVKKGDEMGTYNVYYQGELVATVPLVTQSNIKRDFFAYLYGSVAAFLKQETVKSAIGLLLSVLFLTTVITFIVRFNRKKRRIQQEREERIRRAARARRTVKK